MVYALRDLGLSALKLGIVVGAISVGGVAGATVANRVRQRFGFGRTVLMTTIFAAGCPLVLLIPSGNGVGSLGVLMLAEVLFGFNVLVFNVNTITLRQTITPNRLLGRMNASYRLVLFGPVRSARCSAAGSASGRPAACAGDRRDRIDHAGAVDLLLTNLPDARHADRPGTG